MNTPGPGPAAADAPPGFWRRRLVDPLLGQLTRGVTPDRLAATIAVGSVCSLFPFLGTTSALNLGVGLWLRMNQPVLQGLNQLLGPVQVAMILVYVRIGEWIWRAPEADRFSIGEMIRAFGELSWSGFLQRFGRAGWHAFTAWTLTAPLLLAAIYLPLRPIFRRWATSDRNPSPNLTP